MAATHHLVNAIVIDLHFYYCECHGALLIDEGGPAGWAATTCLSKKDFKVIDQCYSYEGERLSS